MPFPWQNNLVVNIPYSKVKFLVIHVYEVFLEHSNQYFVEASVLIYVFEIL